MIKILFALLFTLPLSAANDIAAQKNIKELEEEIIKQISGPHEFIYVKQVSKNKVTSLYYCVQIDGEQILFVNDGEANNTKLYRFTKPDLFKQIKNHDKQLFEVQSSEKFTDIKDEINPDNTYFELGINYRKFTHSHYQRLSRRSIARQKGKKLRIGLFILNDIVESLENVVQTYSPITE